MDFILGPNRGQWIEYIIGVVPTGWGGEEVIDYRHRLVI